MPARLQRGEAAQTSFPANAFCHHLLLPYTILLIAAQGVSF
jgi:hypothetical protein